MLLGYDYKPPRHPAFRYLPGRSPAPATASRWRSAARDFQQTGVSSALHLRLSHTNNEISCDPRTAPRAWQARPRLSHTNNEISCDCRSRQADST
jgi:hypothetical protein